MAKGKNKDDMILIQKANKLPHESLESRLVRFYDRPIEQIEKIEAPECDWGEPQGNEVW